MRTTCRICWCNTIHMIVIFKHKQIRYICYILIYSVDIILQYRHLIFNVNINRGSSTEMKV